MVEIRLGHYERIDDDFQCRGSYSTVIKVQNIYSKKVYAAKLLDENEYLNDSKYFNREIDILSKYNHPTIIKFIGFSRTNFDDRPIPIILLEFAPRGSFRDYLDGIRSERKRHGYDDTNLQIILIGVARGMMFLHENEIEHRDLKPGNILLDEKLQPKISDFGLAKLIPKDKPSDQSNIDSTARYMAPEMIKGSDYTQKVDIYSFGIILWETITNSIPFDGLSDAQVIQTTSKGAHPQTEGMTIYFKNLLEKCWSSDPNLRPTFSEIYKNLAFNSNYYLKNVKNKIEVFNYIQSIDDSFKNVESKFLIDNWINSLKHINDLNSKIEQLNNQMAKSASQKTEVINSLKKENNELQDEKKKAEKTIACLQNENKKKDKIIAELEAKIKNLERQSSNQKDLPIIGTNTIENVNNNDNNNSNNNNNDNNNDNNSNDNNSNDNNNDNNNNNNNDNNSNDNDNNNNNDSISNYNISNYSISNDNVSNYSISNDNVSNYSISNDNISNDNSNNNKNDINSNDDDEKLDPELERMEFSKITIADYNKLSGVDQHRIYDEFYQYKKRKDLKTSDPISKFATLFYNINKFANDHKNQCSFIEIQADNPNDVLISMVKNANLLKTIYIKSEITEALFKNGNQLKSNSAFVENTLWLFKQVIFEIKSTYNHKPILESLLILRDKLLIKNCQIYISIYFEELPPVDPKELINMVYNNNEKEICYFKIGACPKHDRRFESLKNKFINLTDVSFLDNVDDICGSVFSDLSNLKKIIFPKKLDEIPEMALKNCINLTTVFMHNSITNIDMGAFQNCKAIRKINIPDSVSTIGDYAFADCENLSEITIPKKVTDIKKGVFKNCIELENVYLSSNLQHIEDEAFYNCKKLKTLFVPSKVRSIGKNALYCPNLTELYLPSILANNGQSTNQKYGVPMGVTIKHSNLPRRKSCIIFK